MHPEGIFLHPWGMPVMRRAWVFGKALAADISAVKRLLPVVKRPFAGCFHKNEVKILEVVKLVYLI